MKRSLTLAQYFKSRLPAPAARRAATPTAFVTISREAGAGGRALAKALVERLAKEKGPQFANWHVFDRNLSEQVAKSPDLRVSLKSLLEEEFHEGLEDYIRSALYGMSSQIKIDHHIFSTVRGVCSVGKAVVVGRAGALITRDLPGGVHVRLVSTREERLKRMMRITGLKADAARRSMDRIDAQRARMVSSNFKKDVADPALYDCVWNTASASVEEIAEALVPLIRRRFA